MGLITIDSLEFDTSQAIFAHAVHVSGDVYAIVYSGVGWDGWLKTVTIDSAGSISDTVIDTFEFDTTYGCAPRIYHISGNIYAIVYSGVDSDGWIVTVEISTAGAITEPVVDSHEFDTSRGVEFSMIHISGTTYAIAYRGDGDDGWLKTITIGNDGSISANPELDSLEFDTVSCYEPHIIHISGDIYAILYEGYDATTKYDARIVTVDINSAGAIENTVVDSFTVPSLITPHTSVVYIGRIFNVAGDIYAFAIQAYNASNDPKVIVYTIEISAAGAIAAAVTDSSEITTVANHSIDFIKTAGGRYALAYNNSNGTGGFKTLDIESDGTIGSVVASATFDSVRGEIPFLFDRTATIMAIVYTGYESDGWLRTLGGSGGGGGLGSAYPSEAITRVTSLIHRYDRGIYTLELGLGEVIADFEVPEYQAEPETIEEKVKKEVEKMAPEPQLPGRIHPRPRLQPAIPSPAPAPTPPSSAAEIMKNIIQPVASAKITEERMLLTPEQQAKGVEVFRKFIERQAAIRKLTPEEKRKEESKWAGWEYT